MVYRTPSHTLVHACPSSLRRDLEGKTCDAQWERCITGARYSRIAHIQSYCIHGLWFYRVPCSNWFERELGNRGKHESRDHAYTHMHVPFLCVFFHAQAPACKWSLARFADAACARIWRMVTELARRSDGDSFARHKDIPACISQLWVQCTCINPWKAISVCI